MIIIPLFLMFLMALVFAVVCAKVMILLMLPLLFIVAIATAAKVCLKVRRQTQFDEMQRRLAYLEARAHAEK